MFNRKIQLSGSNRPLQWQFTEVYMNSLVFCPSMTLVIFSGSLKGHTVKASALLCHSAFFQKTRTAQRWTEKHQKDWAKVGTSEHQKECEDWHTLAKLGGTVCFWCCFYHRNRASMVLLGPDFKGWPVPKWGLRNNYVSQVDPIHLLVLVFFSKGPALLSMNFKELFGKPAPWLPILEWHPVVRHEPFVPSHPYISAWTEGHRLCISTRWSP